MDYGLMAGLGEGLQMIGGAVFKAKFLDKLKEQETVRAEQRLEQRNNAKVADTGIEQDGEGVFWKVRRNQNGDILSKDLAPKNDIDKINNENEKAKLTHKSLLANIGYKQKQIERNDENASLKNSLLQSQIERNNKSGDAAMIRANKPSGSSSKAADPADFADSQLAEKLVKQYGPLVKEYTTDKKGPGGKITDPSAMTQEEVYNVASESIRAANEQGKDPAEVFRRALALRADYLRKNRAAPAASTGVIKLGK